MPTIPTTQPPTLKLVQMWGKGTLTPTQVAQRMSVYVERTLESRGDTVLIQKDNPQMGAWLYCMSPEQVQNGTFWGQQIMYDATWFSRVTSRDYLLKGDRTTIPHGTNQVHLDPASPNVAAIAIDSITKRLTDHPQYIGILWDNVNSNFEKVWQDTGGQQALYPANPAYCDPSWLYAADGSQSYQRRGAYTLAGYQAAVRRLFYRIKNGLVAGQDAGVTVNKRGVVLPNGRTFYQGGNMIGMIGPDNDTKYGAQGQQHWTDLSLWKDIFHIILDEDPLGYTWAKEYASPARVDYFMDQWRQWISYSDHALMLINQVPNGGSEQLATYGMALALILAPEPNQVTLNGFSFPAVSYRAAYGGSYGQIYDYPIYDLHCGTGCDPKLAVKNESGVWSKAYSIKTVTFDSNKRIGYFTDTPPPPVPDPEPDPTPDPDPTPEPDPMVEQRIQELTDRIASLEQEVSSLNAALDETGKYVVTIRNESLAFQEGVRAGVAAMLAALK